MSLNKYFRVCFVIVFGFARERSRFVCLMWLLLLIWVIYFSVSLLSALEHSLFSQERLTVTSNNERFWWKPVNLRHVSTFSPYVHLPAWFEIDLLIFVFKSKHCILGLQKNIPWLDWMDFIVIIPWKFARKDCKRSVLIGIQHPAKPSGVAVSVYASSLFVYYNICHK